MPSLSRPSRSRTVTLPARRATIAAETDVLVVGGGPAGLGAALGAAEAGARVILAERYGFLGGNATAALVMPLMSFHTQAREFQRTGVLTLMPDDHGPGHPVIGGALSKLMHRLVSMGGALAPGVDTGYTVPFDPEIFKSAALDLLDEAGVEFLFHAFAGDVLHSSDGEVEGVVFETKSGPIVIKAHCIVDGTGDGDVAARAGADYEMGREEDGLVQPMTLMFRIGEFERAAFEAYVGEHPDQWRGVHGLWELVEKATQAGELDLPREDMLFFGTPHARELSVNSTRVNRVSGVDVFDLSFAEWQSRKQMAQITAFLKKYVPGFEKAYNIQSGVQVGVRETRRILGEYVLTGEDLLGARRFADVIARGTYPVDIHNPTGKGTVLKRIPEGEAYDIPFRALLPRNIERILTAGRAISGTHEAHSSYRVMPIALATGQAAGVGAALSARLKLGPREVPVEQIQLELLRQGANLGDGVSI